MSGMIQRRRQNAEDSPNNSNGSLDEEKSEENFGLTLMEEIVLLGLKDSEVLRGAILIELSLRNRITTKKDPKKIAFGDRYIEVIDDSLTGEVLLDEASRIIRGDTDTIANWVDLLSGETWNLYKIGYQLKQVRERIAKGLVDKGVLRTEKKSFVLFDVPTHPISNPKVKEALIQRIVDALLGRGSRPSRRTVALCCGAYAANILENAFVGLSHSQREQAFQRVDEMLKENCTVTEKARANGITDVMGGVFAVYSKMDNIL